MRIFQLGREEKWRNDLKCNIFIIFIISITQSATMTGQDITVIIVFFFFLFFFLFFVVCSIVDDHSLLWRGVHQLDVINDEGGLTIAAPLE